MRALSRCGHFHFIRIARIPCARADRAAAADPARALPLEQPPGTMLARRARALRATISRQYHQEVVTVMIA